MSSYLQRAFLATLVPFLLVSTAAAQTGLTISSEIRGETLVIDVAPGTDHKGSLAAPKLRMNPEPSYLEISFPQNKLQTPAGSKSIDRGLIQRIQVLQDGANGAAARVFVMSKPKADLVKTDRGYRYIVHLNQMAGAAPQATASPTSQPSSRTAAPSSQTKPAETPSPPVQAQAEVPSPAPQQNTPVAQPQQSPPVAVAPSQPSTAVVRASLTPVTVVFQDTPLSEALERLANLVGIEALIDGQLSGSVNLSLSEVPLKDALELLVQPYGDQVESSLTDTLLTVSRVVSVPSEENLSTISGPLVQEYFPFKTKDAQKMMEAARKAIPNLSYKVDPQLNIIMVEGTAEEIERLNQLLKAMSPK